VVLSVSIIVKIIGMAILSFLILELEPTLLVMAWSATLLAKICSSSVSVVSTIVV
jgi:hypothetical protein